MECAQLRVTGGGSTTPATYNIPGIYAGTDPGIKFNLYTTPVSYTIPGPAVFSCSGGSTTPASSSAAAVVSTTKTTTTAAAATTTAASSGTAVAQWGQCGGATYTGSTTCVSGSTCVKLNDYYCEFTYLRESVQFGHTLIGRFLLQLNASKRVTSGVWKDYGCKKMDVDGWRSSNNIKIALKRNKNFIPWLVQ